MVALFVTAGYLLTGDTSEKNETRPRPRVPVFPFANPGHFVVVVDNEKLLPARPRPSVSGPLFSLLMILSQDKNVVQRLEPGCVCLPTHLFESVAHVTFS